MNGANDTEIANIALTSPSNLTINQTTGKIYVQQVNPTRTLNVIDPNSNTITTTVPLDDGGSMIVNEVTNELYAARTTDFNNEGTSSILFINGDTLAIRKTLPIPLRASRLAVNPATKTLYVTTANASQRTGVVIISTQLNRTKFDFDGDGRADMRYFARPIHFGICFVQAQRFSAAQFGISTDKITPADFDGDGKTDIAVFRDGVWYWLASSNGSFNAFQFGIASDIPVPADYTGDGRAELAVYRAGVWYTLDLANNQSQNMQFGVSTDKPVPADFDGDGKTDFAVYRDGVWWMLGSTAGLGVIQFGLPRTSRSSEITTVTAAPIKPFIVTVFGMFWAAHKGFMPLSSASRAIFRWRQITTATAKPISRFIETEFGGCFVRREVSAWCSLAWRMTNQFLPHMFLKLTMG